MFETMDGRFRTYPSYLTDDGWMLGRPYFEENYTFGRNPKWPFRVQASTILHQAQNGCQRRYPRSEYPPRSTVHHIRPPLTHRSQHRSDRTQDPPNTGPAEQVRCDVRKTMAPAGQLFYLAMSSVSPPETKRAPRRASFTGNPQSTLPPPRGRTSRKRERQTSIFLAHMFCLDAWNSVESARRCPFSLMHHRCRQRLPRRSIGS